jgi:hypothetical protein
MKINVVIEEVISQEFTIEVDKKDDIDKVIRKKYRDAKLVVDNGNLVETNYTWKKKSESEYPSFSTL